MMKQMKPRVRQGVTTGDVSSMLGIPRAKVVKFFVQGILTGYRNPVTGWIAIDLESVKTLAEKSEIELPSNEQIEKDLKVKAFKRKWAVIPVTQK